MQQGQTSNFNFTQEQIKRLEEIGFKWKLMVSFEQRCHELEAFKSDFGHCNAHRNHALGRWCNAMRASYNKIQQGQKPNYNLNQDQIKCLEDIGFKWKLK